MNMKQASHKMLQMILVFTAMAFATPPGKIRVWLIGDSTVCDQPLDRAPVTGWGTPFAGFFDSTVSVINKARGGRSTRTFISEGRWKEVADSLHEGDWVLMQFGHNDEAKEPQYQDRYTPVPDYKVNLIRFIQETRAKKAHPILITPVTRMMFDNTGHVKETHKEYTAAVWEVGKQYEVPVIDLDQKSRELVDYFGPKYAKVLYMQVDSMEHPHYPAGRKDNTHFSEYGARRMAELVLAGIREQQPGLEKNITKFIAP